MPIFSKSAVKCVSFAQVKIRKLEHLRTFDKQSYYNAKATHPGIYPGGLNKANNTNTHLLRDIVATERKKAPQALGGGAKRREERRRTQGNLWGFALRVQGACFCKITPGGTLGDNIQDKQILFAGVAREQDC